MNETSYRVIARSKGCFDVEMEKPNGRKRTVPGFNSEHEAEAWIIQAKRLIRDANPWTPSPARKPIPSAGTVQPAPARPTQPKRNVTPPRPAPIGTAQPRTKTKAPPEKVGAHG
jgi:hypothetical protein